MTTIDQARAAKQRALGLFARFGTVSGVGITRVGDGYGIKVNLTHPPPRGTPLPEDVDGVPVRVEVVGELSPR